MTASDSNPPLFIEHVPLDTNGAEAVVIWLNRPRQLNAISWDMIQRLDRALQDADSDPVVRAVLIIGKGRAFSAGGDLKAYLSLQSDPAAFGRFMDDFQRTVAAIKYMHKPVVALVNGIALAGGLELLLACDFAYASETATIGDGHLAYGQIGGAGSLAMLPRIIGPFRARELFFSGRLLDAQRACEWGLVVAVYPDNELLDAGLVFARGIAEKSATAVERAKFAMNAGLADGTGVSAAMRLERETALAYLFTSPSSMEGLRAFAEKRKPSF